MISPVAFRKYSIAFRMCLFMYGNPPCGTRNDLEKYAPSAPLSVGATALDLAQCLGFG